MEDFVLMVTPRQRDGGSSQAGASGRGSVVHSEKLLLAMSKLKVGGAQWSCDVVVYSVNHSVSCRLFVRSVRLPS